MKQPEKVYAFKVTMPNRHYVTPKPISHYIDTKKALRNWVLRSELDESVKVSIAIKKFAPSDEKRIGTIYFKKRADAQQLLDMMRGELT